MKKFLSGLTHVLKKTMNNVVSNVNNELKVPDSVALRQPLRERLILKRNELDELGVTAPSYSPLEYGIVSDLDLYALMLKFRLKKENVSEKERRLLTLKAAYYEYAFPEELVLIDKTTVQYFNYLESTLVLGQIDYSKLNAQVLAKNVDYDKMDFLKSFTFIARVFDRQIHSAGFYLPFDFFVHRVGFDAYGILKFDSLEQYQSQAQYIRLLLISYAHIFKVDMPEEYLVLSGEDRTVINILEKVLNNYENTVEDTTHKKQFSLRIVK